MTEEAPAASQQAAVAAEQHSGLEEDALPEMDGVQAILDSRLPHAHTCFFVLELPHYSSKAILKRQLLQALECVTITQ